MTLLFGDFELDEARFELRSNAGRLDVRPKALKLLLHLVNHRAHAVSSEELLSVLWPGETVTAASVKRAVRGARRGLGDSGDSQASIRTVRGLGYQFLLPTLARSATSSRAARQATRTCDSGAASRTTARRRSGRGCRSCARVRASASHRVQRTLSA